jgi:hypothetical protein
VTSAAALKVRAARLDAAGRSLENFVSVGTGKAWLLFAKCRLNLFARQDEWHENSLAGATVIGG